MRKLIPIYILMMFFSTQLFGQFHVGLGGGLSIATMKAKDFDTEVNYRTGFTFSVPVIYQISPRFAAAIIPGFVQKGYMFRNDDPLLTTQMKTNYVQVTPEIRYSPFSQVYAGLGFYYGQQIGVYGKAGNSDWYDWKSGPVTIMGGEETEFGLTPSISYNIGNISLSLRYLHGLTHVFIMDKTNSVGEIVATGGTFNRSFEMAAFYVFGI